MTFLILFSKGLIAKGNIKKWKTVRYLNMRYWIFKYSFIWIHILCYLLDSKSLNKNFKKEIFFPRVSEDLSLLISPTISLCFIPLAFRRQTWFCLRGISICFIINSKLVKLLENFPEKKIYDTTLDIIMAVQGTNFLWNITSVFDKWYNIIVTHIHTRRRSSIVISKIELLEKIVTGWNSLTVSGKISLLYAWRVISEYACYPFFN